MASADKIKIEDTVLIDCLERVSRKDREAFGELYEATGGKLYGLALRLMKNQSLAEEAVQETFIQVWEKAGSYSSDKGKPLTWLLTLCHRRCVDGIRSEELRKRKEGEWSPSESECDSTDSVILLESVRCLNEKQKEIIGLVYYQGLTAKEASEALSLPLPTTKSRLRDALTNLRSEWRKTDV